MCASGIIAKRCWRDNIKVEFIEITKDGVSEAIHGSTKKESKQYTQMGKILLEEEDDKNKEKQTNIQSGRQ